MNDQEFWKANEKGQSFISKVISGPGLWGALSNLAGGSLLWKGDWQHEGEAVRAGARQGRHLKYLMTLMPWALAIQHTCQAGHRLTQYQLMPTVS